VCDIMEVDITDFGVYIRRIVSTLLNHNQLSIEHNLLTK
jgi:hypothetical protein